MKYRDIFDSLPNGVLLFSDKFEDCNEQACHLLACERDDILGRTLVELSPPRQPDGRASAEAAQQYIEAAFSGIPQAFHWQNSRKDGVPVDVEISMKANEIDGRRVLLLSMNDIAERMQIEEALRKRSEYIETVTNNLPIGFAVVDLMADEMKNRTIIYMNHKLDEILGWPKGTIVDRESFYAHAFPDKVYRQQMMQKIKADWESGDPAKLVWEMKVTKSSGETAELLAHEITIPGQGLMVVVFQDITERKQAEAELRERNEFIEAVMDNLPIGLAVHTGDEKKILYMNKRLEEITGWAKELIPDVETFMEHVLLDQASRQQFRERVYADLESGKAARMVWETKITKCSGDTADICWIDIPMIEKNLVIATAQDVTERKQTEEKLRQSEARFRSIFEFAAAGMAIVTLQGEMLQVNPAACRIFGYTEQEFLKQTSRTLTHPDDLELSDRNYQELMAGKSKFVDYEKRYLRKDGSVIWGHTTGAVICDSNNRPIYIVSLIQEITERKLAEEELVKLNKELEVRVCERTRELELANREMESFTYSVSHDLRAPLRAIAGFSEALLEDYTDKLDDDGKTYLRYLKDGSRDMGELIDGLLTLSRSIRGELMREQVDLSVLAKSVLAELYRAEPERQVLAKVAEDMRVDADPRLLKAVLDNLLGNAWKYSSQESDPCIEVGVKEQEGKSVYFVKDNGAGFDMTFADKLFIPFHRLHRADEFSGSGIGLATVERIIHRHGGNVWAESAVGEGATFFFTLEQG